MNDKGITFFDIQDSECVGESSSSLSRFDRALLNGVLTSCCGCDEIHLHY